MTPFIVLLAGLAVIGICAWVLSKSGRAVIRRKIREAAAKDAQTFGKDDTIG